MWLGLAGLAGTFLFLPLGLIVCVAALVVGIRAVRRARRGFGRAPGATIGIVVGSAGLAMCLFAGVIYAIVGNELYDYEDCKEGAATITDKDECWDKYIPKIERELHVPKGTFKKSWPLY